MGAGRASALRSADRPVKTALSRETRRLKKLAHWFIRWLIGPWIDAAGAWLERRRPWIEARRADIERLRYSPHLERLRRGMLALDSWIDSSVWGSGHSASGSYERFALFMERFHVTGAKRIAVEVGCEAFTLSIAGGFVLLALAIPAFELTSEDWLKKQDLAVTFLDRYGQEVGRRGIRHDDAVPFDELPPNLIHALIATEDRRFFDHYGIDVIGTMRALLVNSRSEGVRQGGSSLTQQLAKNLFLSNERTLPRKVNEAFLALWLEAHLSKREILSLYLDRAYLGGGTFGVQAASEFYFGKSVRDLTLPEAAMIAGLFKAPTKYAPHINLPAARARANDVLNNMVEAGYLTAGQIYAAQRNPATPVDRQQETSPDWYLDWAYNEVRDLASDGKFGDETVLTVRTGLDPALQQHVEATIESYLRQYGQSSNVGQAAAVILDPNGAVRAIVGGRDYGVSQFNRATDALRQPGSSFKPYLYLTALMSGKFKPSSVISGASLCLGKDYCPHNYDDETAGRLTLSSALAMSLNTAAIRLSIEIGDGTTAWNKAKDGRAKVVATARRMGITTPLPDTVSLPLGADAVKVIEHAGAYATFASGGKHTPPYAASTVTSRRGEVLYEHDRDGHIPEQVIDPNAIAMMNTMLRQVVTGGTGRAADIPGLPVAGKTGTTNGYHDAWFVGFTGNYVGAVWYGNDDYQSMNEVTGGKLPARTWHDIMEFAHQNVEPKPVPGLPAPSAKVAVTASGDGTGDNTVPRRPATLTKATADVLASIANAASVAEMGRAPRAESMVAPGTGIVDMPRVPGKVTDLR